MTLKKIRKQKSLFTFGKTKKKSKKRKSRVINNQKTSLPQKQTVNSYQCNDYYIDHPYFNIIFGETHDFNIECPELLEHTCDISFPEQSNVSFSTLLTKVDDKEFNTVYVFA